MARQRVIIIGATSSIAEHCVRRWLDSAPADVLLVGRSSDKLARVARDLEVRSPDSTLVTRQLDFQDPEAIRELVDTFAEGGAIDIALVAHGNLPDQQACQTLLPDARDALLVNGVSPALCMEALAAAMQKVAGGKLVVIGSVAGDRGRKSNYIYGSAKGLIERYAQGLQHRLHGTGVEVCLVKPGPTRTPMTAGLEPAGGSLADVEEVAETIVKGVARGKPVIYAPGKWWLIMMVIRHLPRFIFNKLDI
jgi:short-subunit dehydrogenase